MSDMDFWTNINLHKGQLKDAVIGGKSDSAVLGQLASVEGVLYIYDGNERTGSLGWTALGSTSAVEQVANDLAALTQRVTTAEGDIDTLDADLNTESTGLKARMTAAEGSITSINTAIGTDATAGTVKGRISALETTVGGPSSGLVQAVATNTSSISAINTEIGDNATAGTVKGRIKAIEDDYIKSTSSNLANYYTKTELDGKLGGAFHYMGSVATISAIPASPAPVKGDVWNITTGGETDEHGTLVKAGDNVAYSGTGWDVLAGTADMSAYYTKTQVDGELSKKVDKVADAALLSNTDKAKYDGYEALIQSNTAAIGDANSGLTQRVGANEGAITTLQAGKVDKVSGKGLSTEDYTTAEKTKLAGVATGAQVNVIESVTVNSNALVPDANKNVSFTVPTKTSEITNNSGFITKAVDDLTNYYPKTQVYTQTQINGCFAQKAITTAQVNGTGDYIAEVTVSGTPLMAQLIDANGNIVLASIKLETNKVTVTTNSEQSGTLNILVPVSITALS